MEIWLLPFGMPASTVESSQQGKRITISAADDFLLEHKSSAICF